MEPVASQFRPPRRSHSAYAALFPKKDHMAVSSSTRQPSDLPTPFPVADSPSPFPVATLPADPQANSASIWAFPPHQIPPHLRAMMTAFPLEPSSTLSTTFAESSVSLMGAPTAASEEDLIPTVLFLVTLFESVYLVMTSRQQ
jgi:hypothetical protein